MGGGGMSMMIDGSFDRLVRSYGGSGDTLDYSKIPADVRDQTNRMNERFGSPPLPTSGSISKSDFRAQAEQRLSSRFGGGAGGRPTGVTPPTSAPAPGGGVVVLGPGGTTDSKPNMTMTMSTGGGPGGPGGWGGGGQGGGQGGWGGGQMDPDSRFNEMDVNPKDGKLSKDELRNSRRGSRLLDAFDQHDTNRDGAIDQNEYRAYFSAAMSGGWGGGGGPGGGGGGPGGWGGGGPGGPGGWGNRDEQKKPIEEQDEPKPVVYRFGHLPQGLPPFFIDADSDKDGQIGLYEWVKYYDSSESRMIEFKALDTNTDGLLTVEEYMRVKKINPTSLTGSGGPGRGGPPSFGTPGTPGGPGSYAQPPAEGTFPSPTAPAPDASKDGKDQQKKEERRDSRDSRDPRQGGGDSRSQGGDTRQRSGDTRSRGGDNGNGGGGNPFNSGSRSRGPGG
jgi:hypothetical protein